MSSLSNSGMHYKVEIDKLGLNTSHKQILLKIPEKSRVLDIGCACGDLGEFLVKHKFCTVYGMEYDEDSIAEANRKGYTHIEQIDLNTFSEIPSSFLVKFDRIIFADVLEHLYDPLRVLKFFLPLLGTDGSVIISLPNIGHGAVISQLLVNKFNYTEYGILDKTHLRFFTYESIALFAAHLQLKITSSARILRALPDIFPWIPVQILPDEVMEFILENPHAFVMQYVFEAIPSNIHEQELILHKGLS